nr:unnamed protein product [Digitaria exilis]
MADTSVRRCPAPPPPPTGGETRSGTGKNLKAPNEQGGQASSGRPRRSSGCHAEAAARAAKVQRALTWDEIRRDLEELEPGGRGPRGRES